MRPAVALLLALPRGAADRRRAGLLIVTVALAGTLLTAAIRLAGIRGGASSTELSNYVTEPGLRSGLVTGILLLCIPVVALLLQALRVGALARSRRTAGLRLAGGTPGAVRTVAAAVGAIAGALGGLLAGPQYLVLGVLLRAAPSRELHVLPEPTGVDLGVWLLVVALVTVGAALSALLVERRSIVDPLSVGRHRRSAAPGTPSLVVLALGVVLVTGALALPSTPALVSAGAGGLLVAFAGGGWFVRGISALLMRAEGARSLVVGGRLAADLRAPGRVAAVLLLCGIAFGLDLAIARDFFAQDDLFSGTDFSSGGGFSSDSGVVSGVEGLSSTYSGDDGFYATGFLLAAAATTVSAVIAMVALVVGAVEGLIDGRRPLAGLAALGAGEAFLARALRLELTVISAPPVFVGIAVAGLLPSLLAPGALAGTGGSDVLVVLGVAVLGALAMALVSALLTWLLRRRIRETVDPSNLRAA